ncbi:cytochrome D1 domain-containing protein [Cupriavidus basilensis]
MADLALSGMPHLGSGITWVRDGHDVMASPNLKQGNISVIDMQSWQTVATVPTNGPGFFLRSHENTPYAWADAMMSPKRDTLQLIDKQTLAVVGSVTPSPGRTAAHVEFTRDGRYALVSLMERDGAIVVYDARTLREVRRIPMDKPIGKATCSTRPRARPAPATEARAKRKRTPHEPSPQARQGMAGRRRPRQPRSRHGPRGTRAGTRASLARG